MTGLAMNHCENHRTSPFKGPLGVCSKGPTKVSITKRPLVGCIETVAVQLLNFNQPKTKYFAVVERAALDFWLCSLSSLM